MKAQRLRVIVSWHWVSNRLYLTVSMMFNRLRTIWPKGYQHGSLGKSHQKGDYKQAMLKNGSSWASALVAFRQGHREGGSEVRQWPRCPWSLGGPSGGLWASRGPWTSGGLWKWHWQISLCNIEDLFFLEIASKSEKNCGHFLFFFEVHKAGDAQYLSWPLAYVWLSAPLQTINDISIAFCGK